MQYNFIIASDYTDNKMLLKQFILLAISSAGFQFKLSDKFIDSSSSSFCSSLVSIYHNLATTATISFIKSTKPFCEVSTTLSNIPFTIETVDGLHETKVRRHLSVVMISSIEDFYKFHSKLTPTLFNYQGKFLFVLRKGNLDEVAEILKSFWSLNILNVNILFQENSSTFVYTYSPFLRNKCDDASPVLIYEIRNESSSRAVGKFFIDKTLNLNGCQVRVATSNNSLPYIFQENFSNGTYRLYGRDIKLIESLSGSLNFSINYTYVGEEGSLHKNGSASGPFLQLLQNKADIIVADYWLVAIRLKYFDNAVPYYSQQIAFMIPYASELSSFEKFLRPLDIPTWILLSVFVLIGIVVVFAVEKFSPKHIQNFVLGSDNSQPLLNLLLALFGFLQSKTPRNNFARFLLIAFVMFCLVMRTLYTGSLYRMLQEKAYHVEVKSMKDMIRKDFTIYHIDSLTDLFAGAQSQLTDR